MARQSPSAAGAGAKNTRKSPARKPHLTRRGLAHHTNPPPPTHGVDELIDRAVEAFERVPSAFGADKFARLVAVKWKYDPQNVFRMNQNIAP